MSQHRGHLPRIIMRADARPELGGGHITRCLALADAARFRGADVAFACNPGASAVVPRLDDCGFPVLVARDSGELPVPSEWNGRADAAIIDLYDSTVEDERGYRAIAGCVAAYEDLPERIHDCDLLIDQSLGASAAQYAGRIGVDTTLLLGPQYYAAREEFITARPAALARRQTPELRRILISMGLTDVRGISWQVARVVLDAFPGEVEVILGARAQSREALETLSREYDRLTLTIEARDIARRMTDADLAIGAGGGTALERCILGLPSLILVLADNQLALANHLHDSGAAERVSPNAPIEKTLPEALARMTPERLAEMAQNAQSISDGAGAARLAEAILTRL